MARYRPYRSSTPATNWTPNINYRVGIQAICGRIIEFGGSLNKPIRFSGFSQNSGSAPADCADFNDVLRAGATQSGWVEMRNWSHTLAISCVLLGGCTPLGEYLHNGFKVGPNYATPPAPVKQAWIDVADKRVRADSDDLSAWWTVFGDPVLNKLVTDSYSQNLTLREAGFRILQARAQRQIAVGNIFPQQQIASGSYRRFGIGDNFFDQWNMGFNLSWELDFWGRYRRAITAADATVDVTVADYDGTTVTLLSDVATNYVIVRTNQEQIRLVSRIVTVQRDVLTFIKQRLEAGAVGVTELDRAQAQSNLEQTEAQIDGLQIELRQAENRLCTLLGMPATDLSPRLDGSLNTTIPVAPGYVCVGIPADLLRRRPDIRRAERLAAAQAEEIGIAETDLYPMFTVNGTLGWQASKFSDLFNSRSLNSNVGPSFQWNLLNYGRITNNIALQDARFQELVVDYQQSVLQADQEVENGIITFLKAHDREQNLRDSVDNAYIALEVIVAQYEAGQAGVDFNRYATIVQSLVQQQNLWVQSRGQIAQGLIDVYRALGGGWQLRLEEAVDRRGELSPLPAKAEEVKAEEVKPIPEDNKVEAPAADAMPLLVLPEMKEANAAEPLPLPLVEPAPPK